MGAGAWGMGGACEFAYRLVSPTTKQMRSQMQTATDLQGAASGSQSQNEITERVHFETLLTDIAARLVNLPLERIDKAIIDSQRQICDFLGLERSVLWQFIKERPDSVLPSHIHNSSDGSLPDAPVGFADMFPRAFKRIIRGKTFCMERLEDLDPDAARDRDSFVQWGIKSCFMAPLSVGGTIIGALSFCSLNQEKRWRSEFIQRLQLVAHLFATVVTRKQAEERLGELKRFETLITEISAHFSNLPTDRIDSQIEDAQRRVCECLDVDLSALWQWSDSSSTTMALTHLHSPPEGPERPEEIDAQEAFPWSFARINEGKTIVIYTESMPPDAARDQEMRRHFGVESSVGIPLSVGERPVVGFLSFDSLKKERRWPEPIVARLELIGQVFANAIIRKQAVESLESIRRFESLVTEVSTLFANLNTDQVDAQIEDTQRRICECLDMDLSTLWQWSGNSPHFLTITHMHSPPEGPERPEGINAEEAFPWALEKMMHGEVLVYSTESMPSEAARDQESRRHFGVESSVNIPLSTGGGPLIGVLTFDTVKQERILSKQTVEKLCLIGELFANALTRKRADLQMQESQLRLSTATEFAGVGLWAMESDTGYVWVTPRTRSLFHFKEDETLDYDSFDRVIDPADRERVMQATQAAIRSGKKLETEFRIRRPDGSVRWIRAHGNRLPYTKGKAARLMGASIDITDHRQMEKRLQTQLDEIKGLKQQLERDNINLRKEIDRQHIHDEIVSRSPAMTRILGQVEQVAGTEATVLIEGETGTGKELLARAVHRMSGRKDRPLVTVNCASLPPTLVESELFGREKGAYTGALTRMTGRFEMADGATLFLDEIGELPFDVQAKLLRVLEEGSFERLGSTRSMKVNVRFIAATNQDLSRQVDNGRFRKDLYYRLNVFPIHVPPLKERPEDIPQLVWTFVKQYEKKIGRRIDRVPRRCMEDLQQYTWPGNVRELRNLIERALIVCTSRTLEVPLPQRARAKVQANQNLEDFARTHILTVLQQTGWLLSGPGGAAGILGLKRTTLQSKMKKLGIQRPKKNST